MNDTKLPITLGLPKGFLDPEVRSGCEVSTKLKKIWAVELDLFLEFSRVCQKHNIEFHVCCGTLLGAVRHHGFIPWDDDFDVWMTRENFNRLLSVSNEFKHPYFLQTPLSDRRYFVGHSRLRNSETTGAVSGTDTSDYNNGIYIDVYVLDGLIDSRIKRIWQYLLKRIVVKFLTLYFQKGPRKRTMKECLSYLLKPVSRLLPYEAWNRLYDQIMSMYNQKTDKLTFLLNGDWNGKKWYVTKAELSATTYLRYEDMEVPVPEAYHEILTRTYGDYMKFPDPEVRGKWHEGQIRFEPEVPYKEYLAKRMAK